MLFPLAFIFFLPFILIVEAGHDFNNGNVPAKTSESSHTNNWAVLVCASRYWFNYRVRIVGHYMHLAPKKTLNDSTWRMRWGCTPLSNDRPQ